MGFKKKLVLAVMFAASVVWGQTWNIGASTNVGGVSSVTATLDDGILTISGTGAMRDFSQTSGITTAPWRGHLELLTAVFIEDGVTIIGVSAFSGCTGLTEIIIPNSVTTVGVDAFSNTGLIEVTIPNSVTSIGTRAFLNCTNLTSVAIGNSVTNIGSRAFSSTGLTEITIPNSVTSISDSAFANCANLTSVTIGNSVRTIGRSAFSNTGLTEITIPNSVISIGTGAFFDCINLTSVTIGNSVTSIGGMAFTTARLTEVINYAETPQSISSSVFFYTSNTIGAILKVPFQALPLYQSHNVWQRFRFATLSQPTVANRTYNSITIDAVSASAGGGIVEYAISTTNSIPMTGWQTGLTFTGLALNTPYHIFARCLEDVDNNIFAISSARNITTDRMVGAEVSTPTIARLGDNRITINAVWASGGSQAVEYAIRTSNTPPASGWQTERTFTGLTPNTTYYIFARSQQNATHLTGLPSLPVESRTLNNWTDNADASWYFMGETEFTITTPEQLAGLALIVNESVGDFSGKTVRLENNISLNNTSNWQNWATSTPTDLICWTPIGTSENPFRGTFEGNGFVVSGVYLYTASDNQGLFGSLSGGRIEKLGIVASFIRGGTNVGGLVGNSGSARIEYCFSMANVAGTSNVGGLIGSSNGTIAQCYATGSISGTSNVGGLIGNRAGGTITSSFFNSETLGRGDNGTGRTAEQMRTQSNYLGWDFREEVGIWKINSEINDGFPYIVGYHTTSIRNRNRQTIDSRHGIILDPAVATNTAKISIKTPEQAQITLRILDNLGNVVFETSGRSDEDFTWDLTNNAGRFVGNGTYLIVVEAIGVDGRRFSYSSRIGVNR